MDWKGYLHSAGQHPREIDHRQVPFRSFTAHADIDTFGRMRFFAIQRRQLDSAMTMIKV